MASELAVKTPLQPTRFVIQLAEVVRLDPSGCPIIALQSGAKALQSASYVAPAEDDDRITAGCTVLVAVDESGALPPIVLAPVADDAPSAAADDAMTVSRDKERLVLEADREIELRCGKSSITLTREGKVILKGVNIVSRASGTNKIKGASVNIN